MTKSPLFKFLSIFTLVFFIAGCSMLFDDNQTYDEQQNYEEHLYPHILEQINETARFFYYNLAGIRNVHVGPNEEPGVCNDYASHFVDNYTGPGQIYRVITRPNGEDTVLERRVKVFERSDIKFSTEDRIDTFYNHIMTGNDDKTPPINWGSSMTFYNNPESQSFDFHTNRDGTLYIVDNAPIPTPLNHAGRPSPQFYNHAWVRIIWNGITVDIDPTWYDNGVGLSQVIKIIN